MKPASSKMVWRVSNPVRVSIGFAIAEADDPVDFDVMKHQASNALNEAKKSGRNRCFFFSVGRQRPPS